MTCLKNYIGIDVCDAPTYAGTGGASGLFINRDLPINLEQMGAIADSEQVTFLNVWDEVQERALKKYVMRVKGGYKELYGVCDIEDAWFCTHKETLSLSLLYFLGSELMFERMYSTRINRFTTIDRAKAKELKDAFDAEFTTTLKDALDIINAATDKLCENGDVFTTVEVLP